MVATLRLNADLGHYSPALGAAHVLSNGNWHFTSGFITPDKHGRSVEVQPDGSVSYVLEIPEPLYRSYRVKGLYGPPALP
jgi:hypothetical protein